MYGDGENAIFVWGFFFFFYEYDEISDQWGSQDIKERRFEEQSRGEIRLIEKCVGNTRTGIRDRIV